MDNLNDLLTDPIFTATTTDGPRELSLCEALERLGNDTLVDFTFLQPHQQQPLHSFLCQLAAMCIQRNLVPHASAGSGHWREALTQLSRGITEAWQFVVADLARPAFLQPPVPAGSVAGWTHVDTPDQLDMLVTAKNHDLKMARIADPRVEHWLFALLTLQTQQGFLGAGNYGIARMNGGFGSRPLFAIDPSPSLSSRFMHDVGRLCAVRSEIIGKFAYDAQPEHALLWLEPWSGTKSEAYPLRQCDPYAVEICRRVRFAAGPTCLRSTTAAARVDADKSLKGVTGDPWTPINRGKETKALNIGASGFRYDLVRDILFGLEYDNSLVADPAALPLGTSGWIVAQCLARGQGGTEGYHERLIPFPSQARRLFASSDGRVALAERSRAWVDDAGTARIKVLYPALRALITAGDRGKVETDKLRPWGRRLETAVDEKFFQELWDSVDVDAEQSRTRWREGLFELVKSLFREATHATPFPSLRRYKAVCAGERVLYGAAKRELEINFNKVEVTDER